MRHAQICAHETNAEVFETVQGSKHKEGHFKNRHILFFPTSSPKKMVIFYLSDTEHTASLRQPELGETFHFIFRCVVPLGKFAGRATLGITI